MQNQGEESISIALERLALTLGESGAVPVPELVRALERAAERLRTRSTADELPGDLVTQSEAARIIGVSRQAVNQWVRKGTLRSYVTGGEGSRYAPEVSLAEVAIAANRRTREVPFSSTLRREILEFLTLIESGDTESIAAGIKRCIEDESFSEHASEESRVLREFVVASMGVGDQQHEFTQEGVQLLAELGPMFEVDLSSDFGRLCNSLGLLIASSAGRSGFDAPVTALLGLIGAATVGTQYEGEDSDAGRRIAAAAEQIWSTNWHLRLYDAAYHIGELRPSPLTRYSASLVYLDYHRFLRQAQSTGVTIGYSRGPGIVMPQRYYGAPITADILSGHRIEVPVWSFTRDAAQLGRPNSLSSADNPFRIMNYEFGLLDNTIHGIRRYCFSAADAGAELRSYVDTLSAHDREVYTRTAVDLLSRTLAQPQVELVSIDESADFDWWKDHIIRCSPREIMLGLRDERARGVAHALLVQTSMLPSVVEAADDDASLRNRLGIYVKNLEFDVIDARYQDDLRRGATRIVKSGGQTLTEEEIRKIAEAEVTSMLEGKITS